MLVKCFGEFMGTLVLILLGDGVVANVLLKRSKAEGAGWMVITSGWAFAVMAGVFTAVACGSSDAHINPAVTFGFAVETGNSQNSLNTSFRRWQERSWERFSCGCTSCPVGKRRKQRLQVALLLHDARHTQFHRELDQR